MEMFFLLPVCHLCDWLQRVLVQKDFDWFFRLRVDGKFNWWAFLVFQKMSPVT
jgi:hypothetical protein